MQRRRSESTVFPETLDLTSSPTTVYVRENIMAEERGEGSTKVTMYVYDETEYSREEYGRLVLAQSRADIDYIAIMTGVDL